MNGALATDEAWVACEKVVYNPKHNLLIRHGGGSRMLVMRPDFDKLDWEKVK